MISGDRSVLADKRGAFWYTLDALRAHWERIDVITPKTAGAGKEHRVFDNVFFHPSPLPLALQPMWIIQKGGELQEKHRHNVMTVHEYPPFYNGFGALTLRKQTGLRAACEIHHLVGFPRPASLTERVARPLSRFFLPRELPSFDAVRVVNAEVRETLVGWGVERGKIHIVPSFYLDGALLHPGPVEQKRHDLVFAARLHPNKGLFSVLRAVSLLPGVTLLVIGDGPQRLEGERFARGLKIADRVRFAGWLSSQRELADALRSGRAFVMNSLSEGGPRVLLEALACGVPVIATDVGVVKDAVFDGGNGILTNGTPQGIAAAATRILADDGFRLRAEEGAAGILKKYERGSAVRAYAEFLRGVAA